MEAFQKAYCVKEAVSVNPSLYVKCLNKGEKSALKKQFSCSPELQYFTEELNILVNDKILKYSVYSNAICIFHFRLIIPLIFLIIHDV